MFLSKACCPSAPWKKPPTPAASIATVTTPSSRSRRAAAGATLRVRARAAALRALSLSKVAPHRTRLRVAPRLPRPPAAAHLIRLPVAAQSPASWNGISAIKSASAPNASTPCASASNSPSSRRQCNAARLAWPFLRAVENAHHVQNIAGNLVDDDVREGRHYQFTRSLFLAMTPAVGEAFQGGCRAADLANQACGVLRCFLE